MTRLSGTPRIATLRGLAAALLLVFTAAASAQGLLDLVMSPAEEKRIGAQEHPKILEQFGGAYDDPELSAYTDSIGQLLARTSGAPGVGYTFTVLNSPVVNAFALPGGYVYVTRGLIALADNEAELAGVLAHEIGHVVARHGAKRQSKSVLATLGLAVLGVVTENPDLVSLGQIGAMAVISGYSREEEHEADRLGVGYLSRAGFAPEAMSSFLDKLGAHSDLESKLYGTPAGGGFDFFATHPRTADRVARAAEAAARTNVYDPIEARDIYLSKIDGIIYGDDPEQGFVRGRRFVHPIIGFEFTVPPRFRLLNGQREVIARGPDGAGIQFDLQELQHGVQMRRYIRRVWAPEAKLSALEPLRINGMEAATALVPGGGPNGSHMRLLAVRFQPETVARFVFVMPRGLASRLESEFRDTVYSFRRVSKRDSEALRPWRLRIHTVREGEGLATLARSSPVDRAPLQQFRVLNGLQYGEPVRPGQLVKRVVEE